MSAAAGHLAHIFRHPIKAHGREELASVRLSGGGSLPWDRTWAVAHDLSKFDPAAPAWVSCANFQRGARTPAVMAIEARFDPETRHMRLTHPRLEPLEFDPETEGARLIDWLAPISPTERFRPVALVRAPGRAMTDSDYPGVSIKNLASNAALSAHMGRDLSIHRWRGNFWLDGFAPWEEFGWIGRRLKIGAAVIEIRERVGRCKATTVDPATGEVDADTLGALREVVGAQDFGVFGVVIEGGNVARGDRVEVLE
ncbi:MOSC domain-containing protein [Pseudogemmobacter humi]|uniref:MOSC domain protein n=1 Tax=Pseudogemmobacter humi TaxID=2483812 RepID=A0A3P5X2W7_9RHOB|nr:MOSC N-terminal beta barrel domain-containing protein [Pseudogemmobacter humi]VDC29500.1 MOSC domain protein [Pseudogemmobacter humi]